MIRPICFFLTLQVACAFLSSAPFPATRCLPSTTTVSGLCRNRVVLSMSGDNEESATEETTATNEVPPTESVAMTTEDDKPYPIDVPSPILLATSMVSAIAGVGKLLCFPSSICIPTSPRMFTHPLILVDCFAGSLFELSSSNGSPQFGFGPTAAIAAIGVPVSLFLFYASILKAQAETAADDEAFLNQNKPKNNNVNKYY